MKKLLNLTLLLSIFVAPLTGFSQQKSTTTPQTATTTTPRPALAFGLAEDTPIRLRLNRNLSSGTEKVNDKVDFSVVEDVKIGDVVVIPQGATAIATVTEAKAKGRMGRSGKLNMNIDYVQLASGDKVALRATKGGNGGNHVGAMTGAIVATSIIFFPAAPFFLFMKGKNINIPKGTEITAYVAADTSLDPAKFTGVQVANSTAPAGQTQPGVNSQSTGLSTLAVKSSPDGADITINGKYMGNTPSNLNLAPGEYNVVIEKSGFKPWQRTMTIGQGSELKIDATLDKKP